MWIDPVVQEIRAARDAHATAQRCDADLIYLEIKQNEQQSKQRGVKFISLSPRPARLELLHKTETAEFRC